MICMLLGATISLSEGRVWKWTHHWCCRQAVHLVTHGSILPLPPHLPTEKATKHLETLQKVYDVLMAGWMTNGLHKMPFRDLEHAARHSDVIDEAKKAMGCPSYRALWDLLTTAFPGLRKTSLNVKGPRDHDQARDAANQILGNKPMRFSQGHARHPLTRRVLGPNFKYYYSHKQLKRNVFMDAGKADPPAWAKQVKGITQLGAPRDPIPSKVAKLRV